MNDVIQGVGQLGDVANDTAGKRRPRQGGAGRQCGARVVVNGTARSRS